MSEDDKKLTLVIRKKLKLCRPPTSICAAFGRVYVSTKGKRVFYTEEWTKLKSILFSSQVNTLCLSEERLACGQKNGTIFILDSKHKTVSKISSGTTQVISILHTSISGDFLIGSENSKLTTYNKDLIVKNVQLASDVPLVAFDLSKNDQIAACSQNDQNIQLINPENKERTVIKITDGYPEVVKFIKEDMIIVGNSAGMLSCFSTINKKRISFYKFSAPITAIHLLSTSTMIIGTICKLYLIDMSSFNTIQIIDQVEIDGIPVDFCGDSNIYCAISRESRLGRWQKVKEGHNQIISIEISPKIQQ